MAYQVVERHPMSEADLR